MSTKRRFAAIRLFAALMLMAAGAAGCRQDMHDAPRYDPLEPAEIFANGSSARPIVAGTVPRGQLNDDEYLHTGKGPDGLPVAAFPFAITHEELDRGQERFNVYCAPCHGRTGVGNGMVVQRGYRQAQSLHIERLKLAPVGYFFDVITNGFGAMPDYRSQIPVEDRWKIIAYVRALQLSRAGATSDMPADMLEELKRTGEASPVKKPAAEIHK
ncbi:MAG TPA: cytochrome c [Vicinamibacterales bacterium]|nr:cytochrome c [Vicinamibacterales bacterium]